MAEWLAKAVEAQVEKQEGNQVYPPGKPRKTALPAPATELSEVASALQAMAAAASAGLPVTKAAVRDTVGLIREQVRVGPGLPGGQTRRRIGQTRQLEHEKPRGNGAEDPSVSPAVTRNGEDAP